MNGEAGLVLAEISAGYGETVVLEGISLAVSPGETLAVLGRNGVGKTTLLATVMGHTRLHGAASALPVAKSRRWPPTGARVSASALYLRSAKSFLH